MHLRLLTGGTSLDVRQVSSCGLDRRVVLGALCQRKTRAEGRRAGGQKCMLLELAIGYGNISRPVSAIRYAAVVAVTQHAWLQRQASGMEGGVKLHSVSARV